MPRLNLPLSIAALRDAGDVVQARLCVGCGACVYACRDERISLVNRVAEGLRPVVAAGRCGECHDCIDICPGVGMSHAEPPETTAPMAALRESWGPVLEVWEGHATDPALRADGSSGGLASALALHCIEQRGMHGLLHIAADEATRWVNRSVLSRDRHAVLAATGSRYAPAAPCDGLQAIEDAPGPCVFIGKPCDVQALRKAEALRPALAAKVGVAIGIFCAGTPSLQGTLDLLARHGVDPTQVDELRYRGRGWPGTFAVRMKGSADWRELATYAEAWGFLQQYRPYRCHLCPDGTSEFADIACGDPWYREIAADEAGLSLVVVRTERGREIVRSAIAAGTVRLAPVAAEVLTLSQRELQSKRGAIWGRLLTMKALGVAAPRFQGFSLYRNWLRLTTKERLRSLFGTARRVVARGYHFRQREAWRR